MPVLFPQNEQVPISSLSDRYLPYLCGGAKGYSASTSRIAAPMDNQRHVVAQRTSRARRDPSKPRELLELVRKMHGELAREVRVKSLVAAMVDVRGAAERAHATQHEWVACVDRVKVPLG